MDIIYRQQLRDAIEAGIDAAPSLTETAKTALRAVGISAAYITVGDYEPANGQAYARGCPMAQALLFPTTPVNEEHTVGRADFTRIFDSIIAMEATNGRSGTFRVVS